MENPLTSSFSKKIAHILKVIAEAVWWELRFADKTTVQLLARSTCTLSSLCQQYININNISTNL